MPRQLLIFLNTDGSQYRQEDWFRKDMFKVGETILREDGPNALIRVEYEVISCTKIGEEPNDRYSLKLKPTGFGFKGDGLNHYIRITLEGRKEKVDGTGIESTS